MTTSQIIILSIIIILVFIGYFGNWYADSKNKYNLIFLFSALSFFAGLFLILMVIILTIENNKLKKQNKDKYLKYEKIENVYKLKQL